MTLRAVLLTFRIQRFESAVVAGAAILSVVVSAIVIGMFTAGGYGRCATDEALMSTAFCQASMGVWLDRIARLSSSIVPIFPVVAGLLIGGPIVAKEIENGTARLAWSLGPSRMRWFVQRVIPLLAMLFLACLAVGLTADALVHILQPSINLDASFVAFRARGLLVAVEGLMVGAIALAVGAILGRTVPTIVLTLMLVFAIGIAIEKVEREVLTNEAVVGDEFGYSDENMYLESRLRMPDGAIVTWEQLNALYPQYVNGWDETSGIRNITLYIPGSRYHDIERREAIVLTGIAGLFAAAAAVVTVRRRPR